MNGTSQYPVRMTRKRRKGDFRELKSKKAPGPPKTCAFGARLGNRSVFILDPRLNIILYFPVIKTVTLETVNVTNCHVIATDILFLSSNHRSVQFLYLAASAITLPAILKTRSTRRLARYLLPAFLCAHG